MGKVGIKEVEAQVEKLEIKDGDLLIMRGGDWMGRDAGNLVSFLLEHGKQVMVVSLQEGETIAVFDEEQMREIGWERCR